MNVLWSNQLWDVIWLAAVFSLIRPSTLTNWRMPHMVAPSDLVSGREFAFTTVLSQWDFSHGKFRLRSLGEASCGSCTTQPMVHAGFFSVSLIHQTLTWTQGSLMCAQMLMHAIAHGAVQTHVRESAWKVDWEKNPLPHRGIEPVSAAWQSDVLPMSYIPINLCNTGAVCFLD